MATPAQNPEIQLGFGVRPQGNAVALFGANIFVVGIDDHSDIQQSLGIAWNASVSGGYARTWSNSTSSTLTLPLQQTSDASVKQGT